MWISTTGWYNVRRMHLQNLGNDELGLSQNLNLGDSLNSLILVNLYHCPPLAPVGRYQAILLILPLNCRQLPFSFSTNEYSNGDLN